MGVLPFRLGVPTRYPTDAGSAGAGSSANGRREPSREGTRLSQIGGRDRGPEVAHLFRDDGERQPVLHVPDELAHALLGERMTFITDSQ